MARETYKEIDREERCIVGQHLRDDR